jgi:hypothetical protein
MVWLSLIVACAPARAAAPPTPAASEISGPPEPCPDEIPSTGRYENSTYGFSIVIPKGLDGLWNSPGCRQDTDGCTCMSDHGRVIPLTPEPYEPDRAVEAYTGWNDAEETPTSAALARRNIEFNREQGPLRLERLRPFTLDGRAATRLVAHVRPTKLKEPMVSDVIALVDDGVEYILTLWTPEAHYAEDHVVFEAMAASWKRIPRDE